MPERATALPERELSRGRSSLIPKPERVMAYLRKLYTGLKLQINEAKSAVGSAFGRKSLGYELWVARGREVKCAVAVKALDNFKARIRQLTRRSGGRSLAQVVEKLRPYLLGWKAYFDMAQRPRVWRGLDEWLCHRLRAIQLRHWKGPTPQNDTHHCVL
jgi:RNA-directed DNA polymerase